MPLQQQLEFRPNGEDILLNREVDTEKLEKQLDDEKNFLQVALRRS